MSPYKILRSLRSLRMTKQAKTAKVSGSETGMMVDDILSTFYVAESPLFHHGEHRDKEKPMQTAKHPTPAERLRLRGEIFDFL